MLSAMILCSKWSAVAGAARAAKSASENPEKAAGVFDFIVSLVIYAIIAAIIGAIVAGIAKFVLDKDKDDVEGLFLLTAGVVLVLLVISHFVF